MKNKYLIYLLALLLVGSGLILVNTQGRVSAALQKIELLTEVACDNPVRFKQILESMSAPDGKHSGPIKDNPEVWEAVKQKLLGKCQTQNEGLSL